MAAYAALVYLLNLTEDIQSHPHLSTSLDKKQMESLGEEVASLLNFVERHNSQKRSKEAEDLECQIASAAHAAEDVIESHLVDEIVAGSTVNPEGETYDVKSRLQNVIEAMNSIKNSITEFESRGEFKDKLPEYSDLDVTSDGLASTRSLASSKHSTVGFDDEAIQLIERLIQQEANQEIIPIVGMGGTGKTTLARLVYEHSLIAQHFDVFMWATISQDYSLEKNLSELLFDKKEFTGQTINELGEQLHKKLWGRRYLIVLDDMWSIETWNEIQLFLPNNGDGDRVVITTRLSNVAVYLSSSPFNMNFFDDDKSWKLFCAKAFGEEECPPELEDIGKNIVKKCKGLALSIVVIGGHLRKSSRMKGYWESVGNDMKSILDSGEDDNCLGILSMSYNNLPAHLKPCFLYMGVFEEDDEIYVPRLKSLWISEGLLRPNKDKCEEEIADDYLKDLVDRNLILVHTLDRNVKFKSCKVHDLLRELSIKVARKEKFFCVLDATQAIDSENRVVVRKNFQKEKHDPEIYRALRSAPLVRSLTCEEGELISHFRLLRVVINKVEIVLSGGQLEPTFEKVNLKYLDCHFVRSTNDSDQGEFMPNRSLYLPPSISLVWNLQTLKISGEYDKVVAPSEIWKMAQLRHLDVRRICLPSDSSQDDLILEKLQTLEQVVNFSFSDDVCKRIPNIKTLKLIYDRESDEASSSYYPQNLGLFHKLESLSCSLYGLPIRKGFARSLTFPCSIQKLFLLSSGLLWDDLEMISSLPHLVDLQLLNSAYGPEWNTTEMGFPSLKFFFIYGCRDLVTWNTESSHFPVLEHLHIVEACKLEEIPSALGDIPTLQSIQLQSCKESAAISAVRMLVEQQELGNDDLKLEVIFDEENELESFREMVQDLGLSCSHLRLSLAKLR